jgi:hypothetical protein
MCGTPSTMPSRSCRTRPDDRDGRTCTATISPVWTAPHTACRNHSHVQVHVQVSHAVEPDRPSRKIMSSEFGAAPKLPALRAAGWVARRRHRTLASRLASRWSRPLPPLGVTRANHCRVAGREEGFAATWTHDAAPSGQRITTLRGLLYPERPGGLPGPTLPSTPPETPFPRSEHK